MSPGDGFARAQRSYDLALPPDDSALRGAYAGRFLTDENRRELATRILAEDEPDPGATVGGLMDWLDDLDDDDVLARMAHAGVVPDFASWAADEDDR